LNKLSREKSKQRLVCRLNTVSKKSVKCCKLGYNGCKFFFIHQSKKSRCVLVDNCFMLLEFKTQQPNSPITDLVPNNM